MPRQVLPSLRVAPIAWAIAGCLWLTGSASAESTDSLKAMSRTLAAYSCKPEVIAEIGTEVVRKARPDETVAQGLRRLPDLSQPLHDAIRACGCTGAETQLFDGEHGLTFTGFPDVLRACITTRGSNTAGTRDAPRPTARQLAVEARNGQWPARAEDLDALTIALFALGRNAEPNSSQAKACAKAAREVERLRALPRKPGTEPPSLWALQAAAADCIE